MASIRKLLLGALLLLTTMPAAWAQERTVSLSLGAASRLALDSSFETVIVGDPLIVEVRTDDDRTVVIEPLKPGATNLVFVDTRGLVIANIRILVCASLVRPLRFRLVASNAAPANVSFGALWEAKPKLNSSDRVSAIALACDPLPACLGRRDDRIDLRCAWKEL